MRIFNENHMYSFISGYCEANRLHNAKTALMYAREKHNNQFRKSADDNSRIPYIYHPLMVACHAISLGFDDDIILAACLLHDVCEDCKIEYNQLPVSSEIRDVVRILTKPCKSKRTDDYEKQYYEAISKNKVATIVKILDRCNNVSTMGCFTNQKINEYTEETLRYVCPLLEHAKQQYPEYSKQLFLIRYHMRSVMFSLDEHISHCG